MTFAYHAVFNIKDPRNAIGTFELSTTGKPSISVDLSTLVANNALGSASTSRFANYHGSLAPTGQDADGTQNAWDELPGSSLDVALEAAIRTAATAQGWTTPSSFTVEFNNTTLAYTLAYPSGITATAFSTTETALLLGFNGPIMGPWTSKTSTQTPDFVIVPEQPNVSCLGGADGLNYETQGITTDAVSAAGLHFSVSRLVTPLCRDWVQQYESKEKCARALAVLSSHPFGHERMRSNCRNNLPFIVQDMHGVIGAEMFKLRAGSSSYRAEPAGDAANHEQLHVPYETYVLGTLP